MSIKTTRPRLYFLVLGIPKVDAGCYLIGLAVSRLRCIPSLKKCHDNSNCPTSYRCNSGRCCRRFVKPTLTCPSTMIPDGFCFSGRCPVGYNCIGIRCCKPRISFPFSCPLNMVSDGFCFSGRCPAGYKCIDKRCCKPRIIQIGKCPKGMKYTGKCSASTPYCKVGSTCLSGSCCSKSIIAMGCPAGYIKVGSCFGGKICPFTSSCINNACCRRIFPPEIPKLKCPPRDPGLSCPAVFQKPLCKDDSECPVGKKCCKVGCEPVKCTTVIP